MDWSKISYFDRDEFDDPKYPGSGDKIDKSLLLHLISLRVMINAPVVIHHNEGGAIDMYGDWGHAEHSYHLSKLGCKAVDFHIKTHLPLNEQLYYVMKAGFAGIGIYPWWNHPGFHADQRPIMRTRLWVSPSRGKYIYLPPL